MGSIGIPQLAFLACLAFGAVLLAGPGETSDIPIGYFGPDDATHPQGGDLWVAAQMAIQEANAGGGCQGRNFRLVPGWSRDPWGTGVVEVTRMVYEHRVWAILGGIDGPSTHLAEQVVAKARIPQLCPVSTDQSVNLAYVPWTFSVVPNDRLQAQPLARIAVARTGDGALVLVSTTDHDSHLFARELSRCLSKLHVTPRFHFECDSNKLDVAEIARRVIEAEATAAVVVASVESSALLVAALRDQGFAGLIFGGPAFGRRLFCERTGPAGEGAAFPLLYQADRSSAFVRTYRARHGPLPDYAAAHTYDAVRLLVDAVRKAGLDREHIRDAIRELSPWTGVTGVVKWDALGRNTRVVVLGTIRGGRVAPLSASDARSR